MRPPFCGAGISSGCWHAAPTHIRQWSIEQIINESSEHRLAVAVSDKRLREGVEGQLLSFSTRRPKSTLQLTYRHQHADCKRKWEEMEVDGVKMKKRNKGKRKGFAALVLPALEAHMPTFIHLVKHHQLPLINHMMVWWAGTEGGD